MPSRKRRRAKTATSETLRALAHSLRSARERKRWSHATLARASGLSKGMLLQIESARTNPSIGTLIHIANAFGVSVWQLFAQPDEAIRVSRASQALTLWRSRRSGTARLLIGSSSPQPAELWEWRLAPGDVYLADAHYPTTFEVMHVHQGALTLVVGEKRVTVPAGGSVVARMDQRHQYRNEGRRAVKMTMVVVDPRR
jgi:transcriptional regulator with XRE-family HTH domain